MALKPITVNTPAAEPAHILAEDDAAIYAALIGDDRVLDIGGKLAATVISNNKVRITDGVVVVGGHAAIIYKGDYEDMTIENGVSGKNRNDLIVARFIAGDDGGADSYSLVVVKGTAGTSATDPAIVQGNLYNGDKQRDYPLWRVKIEGLSITAVEQLYTVNTTNTDLSDSLSQLNENSIEEIGQNGYNHYIKYRDGRLVQWGIVSISYTYGYGAIEYPVPFVGNNKETDYFLFVQGKYVNPTHAVEVITAQKQSMTMAYVYSRQPEGGNTETHAVDWVAWGRWK